MDAKDPMDPKRVIRSYLTISGLFTLSASLIWGINTLFLLNAGLSIFEVFVANAAFTAAMALFEIPTGVVADTRGRRASFLLSEATLAIGTLAYVGVAAIHGGLLLFCLAGVILGLGYTFYSGAVEAWLVDALKATGYTKELDGVFARASTGVERRDDRRNVGGGLLGQISLSLPYLARTACPGDRAPVGYRTMFDIGFTPRAVRFKGIFGEMRKVARAGITYGWRKPAVRLLVMQSFIAYGFFSWAWYAWQPYFLELYGRDAVWLSGLIASLFALAGIAGNWMVKYVATPGRRRTTDPLTTAAVSSSATWSRPACSGRSGSPCRCSCWARWPSGISSPVRQTYFHQSIPTSERATLVSFDSLVGSLGSVGGQTGLGWLSQERSIPAGFVIGGLVTFLVMPIYARLRSLHEPADRIEPDAPDAEAAEQAMPPAPLASDEVPAGT